MPYATDSDLTTRIPATSAATLAQRTFALDDAAAEINAVQVGARTVRAHVLLAAHYLQLEGVIPGGEGGSVTARSAGAISVSYGALGAEFAGGSHAATRYGRMFDALMARVLHPLQVG
jgi:hypothetical protein